MTHTQADDQTATLSLEDLGNRGRTYLDDGDVPRALTLFEEGLERAEAAGDDEAAARFWGYKGVALSRLGNTHFAQIALFKSIKMAREVNDPVLQIDALIQLGAIRVNGGQPAKAVNKFEQALALALKSGDRERQMHAAAQAGAVLFGMDALEKSLEYYNTALGAARALNRHRAACSYLLRIGDIYLANGEAEEATQRFEQALDSATALGETRAELDALSALLRAAIASGRPALVNLYGRNVLSLAREQRDAAAEIAALDLLSLFLVEREQYEQALPHLERGIQLAEAAEEWGWQFSLAERLGYARYQLGQPEAALAAYRQAETLAARLQEEVAVARLLGRIGAIQADLDRTAEALETLRDALARAEALEDPALIGEQQLLLAFLYHEQAAPQEALPAAIAAVEAFTVAGRPALAEQARALLAAVEG